MMFINLLIVLQGEYTRTHPRKFVRSSNQHWQWVDLYLIGCMVGTSDVDGFIHLYLTRDKPSFRDSYYQRQL